MAGRTTPHRRDLMKMSNDMFWILQELSDSDEIDTFTREYITDIAKKLSCCVDDGIWDDVVFAIRKKRTP